MKRNLLSLLFVMSFLAMFGQTATVHVQDGDATAIVGAAVMLNGTSVSTDGGGDAIFSGLADGTYPYTVTADCYVTASGSITIAGADNTYTAVLSLSTTNDVFVNLVPPGGIGFPPNGVTVRLYNDDLSYDQTLVTGGFTVFQAVPYGTYNYTLSQDCKQTVTGTTTVECTPGDIDALVAEFGINQNTNDVFVNLVPPGGIGFPPSGVTVRLYNDDLSYDQTLVTGGFSVFDAVPYGTYNYTLSQDCKVTVQGTTTVECTPGDIDALVAEFGINQNTNDVFVNLVPPGGIGFPPSGVTVRLYNADFSYDQTLVTGGFSVFESVPYGTYNYTLSQDCKQTVTGITTVECTPGDIDALVAEFGINQNTNNLFFFVGNIFQEPGCTITVTNTETFEQTTIEGLDILGSYVIENLPYDEYNYVVSKECFVSQTGQVTVDCQPNDGEGNQLGNVAFLGDMVPSTTNNLFFFVGNIFQEPGCTITVTNTETFEQTTIEGLDILGSYVIENLPYGEYNYVVSKECFVSQTGQVTVDCQPNDSEGNQLGNVAFLGDMVPSTTNNLFFFVGNLQEPGCTITVINTETFEPTTIVGQNILGDYILENLPYGTYDYTVSKDCFVSQTGQVTVDCQPNDGEGNQLGNVVALDGMVPATTGELQFSVTTDLFEDIQGADIHVFTTDLTYDAWITTGPAPGSNLFPNVPYGEVNYEVSYPGRMTVTGTILVECQEGDLTSVEVVLLVVVGVTNTEDQVFDLNAFPNPFANEFSIKLTSNSQDQVQVVVYDMVGRQVDQRSAGVADLQTTKLGSNYPAGVYNIVVSQGDYRKSFLVVKK